MLRFLALLCVFGSMSIASLAHAERRIALVIGNSVYQNTAELKNPKNDAGDMAASLRRLGFDVFEGQDLDKRAMERMIRQFGVKLSGADLALFFYAGHGVAIGGQNYLVPTDARLASEGDADFEGLALTLVLKQMEREAKTSIVLLDACRDNPLARNLARTMGTRSSQVSQGLAEVRTGIGTLIGFSTQPGNVAIDGAGRNSPYAEALLRHIEVSGTDVSGVLIAVRNDVLKATDGRQVPWEHTSLTGQVYLKVAPASTPAAVRPPATNPGTSDRDMELSYWSSVKDSKSPALLQSYLDRYPDGNFSNLARAMLKELSPAAGVSAPGGDPPSFTGDRVELVRSLQTELQRVGCDPGAVDGKWQSKTKGALTQFARLAKLDLYTEKPSPAALDAVRGHKNRVCPLDCGAGKVEKGGTCVAATVPAPPAKKKFTDDSGYTPRRTNKGKGKADVGTCWAEAPGRGFEFVPCNDPRARQKAF
ncbi:MAG TPA: caspase family protein [Burkholderiales bacterium]|nr:caspase family protein [Burkholderiales bacterium]